MPATTIEEILRCQLIGQTVKVGSLPGRKVVSLDVTASAIAPGDQMHEVYILLQFVPDGDTSSNYMMRMSEPFEVL